MSQNKTKQKKLIFEMKQEKLTTKKINSKNEINQQFKLEKKSINRFNIMHDESCIINM